MAFVRTESHGQPEGRYNNFKRESLNSGMLRMGAVSRLEVMERDT
jgi:hypothetical protein